MTVRRVARFRGHHDQVGRSKGPRPLISKLALWLLDVVSACVVILLVATPILWGHKQANQAIDQWSQPRLNDMAKVEMDWMTFPQPPIFVRGDEPALEAYLRAQPLIMALRDRDTGKRLWVRRGDSLVRATEAPVAQTLDRWFTLAEDAHSFLWFPNQGLPDEERPVPKLILRGDRWLVAKRWKEGSPEVERSLRNLLGPTATFRVALLKEGDEARKDLRPQAWGDEPNLQADPYRAQESLFSSGQVSTVFSGWTFTVIPFRAEARAIQRGWQLQMFLAGLASAAVGGALLLTIYIRARARRKAALDADRMASMTHSLKTPLAILKMRCDTLRLGRLSPDQLDSQLIQIGEEADRMSDLIEKHLLAIQDSATAGPQEAVTPEWIRGVAEDLTPAFEAGNRRLNLVCAVQNGKAALPSLKAALLTLVENALFHGSGVVTLETVCTRKRFLIKVSDEGQSLSAQDLEALGRPFMRIRELGQEGFRKEGLGLGLSLLCNMARREGWGLTFASEPGSGLCATLEIQNA
jgi:signal transduction histidine kinase